MSISSEIKLPSESFCTFPFNHLATKTAGEIKPCCRAKSISNIKTETLKEAWNNKEMRELRLALLKGEKPSICNTCWRHEEQGVTSMRERTVHWHLDKFGNTHDKMSEDGSMPFQIPTFEAKLSNLCNLKCRMCHPVDSTSWWRDWKTVSHFMEKHNKSTFIKVESFKKPYVSDWEHDAFWEEFAELAPHFEEIYFAGGEPLMDPLHYKVLHYLIKFGNPEKIKLRYATNMTTLSYKKDNVMELWNSFKTVQINISIDGYGDVYNYIRQLADYQVVKANIAKVKQHPKVDRMMGACTLQVYNIWFLPEIADEFDQMGIELHTHRVNYPEFLDCRVIPPNTKKAIVEKLTKSKWARESHFKDAVATLNGDMTNLIPQFMEFSDTLDVKQQVELSWRDLLPEMADEMEHYVK